MIVTVDIPERLWARVCDVADQRDVRVDRFLTWVITSAFNVQGDENERIISRVIRGLPDKQIARELNLTNLHVAEVRRRAGFKANRRRVIASSSRKEIA